jgi:tyrosine-protein kinase Etk/Wzc
MQLKFGSGLPDVLNHGSSAGLGGGMRQRQSSAGGNGGAIIPLILRWIFVKYSYYSLYLLFCSAHHSRMGMSQGKFSFIDLLAAIVRRRKLIYVNLICVGVISLVVSLLLPKWYKAEAIVLPPMNDSFSLGLGGALGEIAGSMLGPSGYELPMLATRADVYETILKSKRVAEEVIVKFELQKLYKAENIDLAVKELRNHLLTEVGRDGSLKISFEAKRDPKLAADISNFLVTTLDNINQQNSQSKAKNTRIFIETRLEETKVDLANAEMALKRFQEENNTLSLPEQTRVSVESAAQLMGELTALRIQLGVMRTEMSPTHGAVVETRNKIDQIDKVLREMKQGGSPRQPGSVGMDELLLPLEKVPELGLQYARLLRDVKIQEVIYEMLTQQYEQAKIREMEDTPTLQLLQKATPPVLKARPKRVIIILVSLIFALFVSLLIILMQDYFVRLRESHPAVYEKYAWIGEQLKKDLHSIKPGK